MRYTKSRASLLTVLLSLAFVASGCVSDRYEVEMKVDEDGLHRSLEWDRRDNDGIGEPLPHHEVEQMAALYGVPAGGPGTESFRAGAHFGFEVPSDLAGAGFVEVSRTPLGAAGMYIERYRGEDDLLFAFERRERALDLVTELLRGILAEPFETQPGWERLDRFVDGPLRRDLKNVVSYLWLEYARFAMGGSEFGSEDGDLAPRVLLYLAERDYLTPTQAFRILTGFDSGDQQDAWTDAVARIISRELEADSRVEVEAILASFEGQDDLLVSRPDLAALVLDWYRQDRRPAEPEELELDEIVQRLTGVAVGVRLLVNYDRVSASLRLPVRPIRSNGTWSEEEQASSWETELDEEPRDPRSFPSIAYAVWAEPDVRAQEQLLGGARLVGKELAIYCSWYQDLPAALRVRWDDWLGSDPERVLSSSDLTAFRNALEDEKRKLYETGLEYLEAALSK